MIVSFGDKTTEEVFHGVRSSRTLRLSPSLLRATVKQLEVLHKAPSLDELFEPPGNRLKALKGDLAGLWSIRVNSQWRIVFRWTDGSAQDVRLADYH